jgi:flagellar biogenesis protein FliO
MLRHLTILILLAAAGSASAQEPQRTSSYGPPSQRVIQPAAHSLNDEPATEEPAALDRAAREAVSTASLAAEPTNHSPLRLTPRNQTASKGLTRPAATDATSTITTVAGSLGIVLGLFVVLVWFSRRFAPAGTAALPKEAVELLGRTSLGCTHQMQLVRVGTKLLLIALSPQGARTLTEINSAAEVERLSELCRKQKPESATASFRSLVNQIGSERTSSTFVDGNRRTPAAATASPRTRVPARS